MWIEPVVLEREDLRVRLEPLRRDHASGLFKAMNHPELWRLRPDRFVRSVTEMPAWIEQRVSEIVAGDLAFYATVLAETGEIVGSTCFLLVQPENRSVEIGATIVTPAWQRTFVNTHAKLLMLGYAFERLKCVRVQFKVDTRNERSIAAVERLGALREGTLRKSRICHDGYIRDTAVFSVIEAEWPAMKERLEAMARRRGPAAGAGPGQ